MPGKSPRSALGSSTAVEDYLERILELIDAKGYARVVDIASALHISQASVTNMVQRLGADGLLKYKNTADSSRPLPERNWLAKSPTDTSF